MKIEESNRRLLKLAKFLERLPPERFDYSTWVGNLAHPWKGRRNLSCGTQACALGWATTIPEFQRRGLRLTRGPGGSRPFDLTGLVLLRLNTHEDAWGSDAGAVVFGLDSSDAVSIFTPLLGEPDNDPQYVAMKIRMFVEGRGDE